MQLRGHWQCGILQAARGCFPCAEANGSSFEVNVRPGQPEEFPAPRRSVKRRQQENLIARPSGLVGLPEVIFARDIAWMLVMGKAANKLEGVFARKPKIPDSPIPRVSTSRLPLCGLPLPPYGTATLSFPNSWISMEPSPSSPRRCVILSPRPACRGNFTPPTSRRPVELPMSPRTSPA